jgi:hypothetical protein
VAMVNGEGRQLLRGVLHVEEGIRKLTWHRKGGEWRSAQRLTEKGSQRWCSTGAVVLQRLGDGFVRSQGVAFPLDLRTGVESR